MKIAHDALMELQYFKPKSNLGQVVSPNKSPTEGGYKKASKRIKHSSKRHTLKMKNKTRRSKVRKHKTTQVRKYRKNNTNKPRK